MLPNTLESSNSEKLQPAQSETGNTLLLVNVKSRSGQTNYQNTLDELVGQGVRVVEAYPLRRTRDFRPLIARAIERSHIKTVVAGGGDGTISLVADIAARLGLQLGVVPLGTANDLARTLTIPKNIPEAVSFIKTGFTLPVDLGQINNRYYLNVASLGLGVQVAHQTDPQLKKSFGPLAYGLAAFQTLSDMRPFKVFLTFGEDPTKRLEFQALHVAVANGRFYGGGLVSAPNANPFNGQFAVTVFETMNIIELFNLLPGLWNGSHIRHPKVHYFQSADVKVETPRTQSINIDGEICEKTPAHFQVAAGALRVFVPRP